MIEGKAWPELTLTDLEREDWGEPTFPSHVVTRAHRLRRQPLREFTADDLRFMIGQRIGLPYLVPMALDVMEWGHPFAGSTSGALMHAVLQLDNSFWQEHPSLWDRMNVVLADLDSLRGFIERELVPAAERFRAAYPHGWRS